MTTAQGSLDADEVFQRARSGSVDAWEELYVVARPQLFRFARLRLATDDQAEDAVSETMARAIAASARYRAGSGAVAWLVGICRNVVHEAHRSGSRASSIDPVGFIEQPGSGGDDDPEERVLRGEDAALMRRSFARLGPEDQELLALRVVVGLDASAVAVVVGKRAGAVRMAQSRALARLRAYLEEDDRER